MRIDAGLDVQVPPGWNVAARPPKLGERLLLLHGATVPLVPDRGDYGSGVIASLGPDDVFVSLFEHGPEALGTALFSSHGMPRVRPSDFDPSSMQQVHQGMSGAQYFFTVANRTWGLYAVLGSHARRQRGAVVVDGFLRGMRIR